MGIDVFIRANSTFFSSQLQKDTLLSAEICCVSFYRWDELLRGAGFSPAVNFEAGNFKHEATPDPQALTLPTNIAPIA